MNEGTVEFESVDYHEGRVLSLVARGKTLRVDLEGPELDDGKRLSISVRFEDVDLLTVDGTPTTLVAMEEECGELVDLERKGSAILMVIDWMNFREHRSTSRVYRFVSDKVRVYTS